MKLQYPGFTIKAICFFLFSAILFISCRHDQSLQEFNRIEGSSTASESLTSENLMALAITESVTHNIFPSTNVSSDLGNDGQPIEVGVKFRVTQTGYITGIRFYKAAGNTGTHIGHLWSSNGTKLAEATFTSETASGWQQVSFTTPVAVTTGTTYVASYFSSAGFYSVSRPYFTSAVVNGPVRALAEGEDGSNGVFKFSSASVFPNHANQSSNFWVDVVFSTSTASVTPATSTIFPSTNVSSDLGNDGMPIEVGVKFRVTQAGYINGIRFYKSADNTGTHIGHLWSSNGTKLAEATFISETASGWQQVLFTTPVAVTTGTTYVASYFSSAGFYSVSRPYFTSAVVNGPLRALAEGEDGSNGVFKFSSASVFPNQANQSSNFWVDVVFSTNATQIPPPATTTPITGIKYFSLPQGTPQTYINKSNLVIENLRFTNPSGDILSFFGCSNIIIRNCYFGASSGEAINLETSSNVTIENCLFANNRTMVYANRTTGGIRVLNNQFVNAKGPLPRGQFVQFNTCSGPGNLVQGNRGECFDGRANPEELINIFSSKGTSSSPLTVKDNIFRGGGPSLSGGGIAIGDYGGEWIVVENNKLVNPGQQGIGVAGGDNVIVRGNQVFSEKKPWNNIGMFIWAQAGASCSNVSVTNNRVTYTNKDGILHNWWWGGGCSNTNYTVPTSITLAEMNVPAHLISFITPEELLTIK